MIKSNEFNSKQSPKDIIEPNICIGVDSAASRYQIGFELILLQKYKSDDWISRFWLRSWHANEVSSPRHVNRIQWQAKRPSVTVPWSYSGSKELRWGRSICTWSIINQRRPCMLMYELQMGRDWAKLKLGPFRFSAQNRNDSLMIRDRRRPIVLDGAWFNCIMIHDPGFLMGWVDLCGVKNWEPMAMKNIGEQSPHRMTSKSNDKSKEVICIGSHFSQTQWNPLF